MSRFYDTIEKFGLTPAELREGLEEFENEKRLRLEEERLAEAGKPVPSEEEMNAEMAEAYEKATGAIKDFRNAFVVMPKFNYSSLKKHLSGRILYLTDGYSEEPLQAWNQMRQALESLDFDPDVDVIVPVGSLVWCFMLGQMLGTDDSVTFAVYRQEDASYDFYRIRQGTPVKL